MSTSIQLFSLGEQVRQLVGATVGVEKELQCLVEKNMGIFFNVSFLQSEYSTGPVHGGRIDSLGIDDTNCPVIFEYKRQLNENVINQGLFYLDWLMDHKAELELLVQHEFGIERSGSIDWKGTRLICIANDFTRYDEYAVRQIPRNIQLMRYLKFDNNSLMFELVASSSVANGDLGKTKMKTVREYLEGASAIVRTRYESLSEYCMNLGTDVTYKEGMNQFIFKRFRNFACVEIHPRDEEIILYLKIDPSTLSFIEDGFMRDMRGKGHWGTGDLEIRIHNEEELEKAKSYILMSYEGS